MSEQTILQSLIEQVEQARLPDGHETLVTGARVEGDDYIIEWVEGTPEQILCILTNGLLCADEERKA